MVLTAKDGYVLEIPPKYSISEFMGQLKSKSTLMIFDLNKSGYSL